MQNNQSTNTLKILLVGESGTGKSSLLLRYAEDTFSTTFMTTIGIDFKYKQMQVGDQEIRLALWDTAGQEKYRVITSSFYRGAHGVILVYDITNRESYQMLERWVADIAKYAPTTTTVMIVGNKSDMEEKRLVESDEAFQFAKAHKMAYMETSAKQKTNVDAIFASLADKIVQTMPAGNGTTSTVDMKKKKSIFQGWCSIL
eukprot:TRINITY_DN9330_c0_g1_i1.p1 TRINITY_DN9330_c0_g1~~TRINITY_DN9330_c0_g1_i1.p1  ORF type:complete len:201 (-),score=51.32 TRINITY_DN9330_c0_g1_i1:38-640(-)